MVENNNSNNAIFMQDTTKNVCLRAVHRSPTLGDCVEKREMKPKTKRNKSLRLNENYVIFESVIRLSLD